MRVPLLFSACLVVALVSCKTHKTMTPPVEARDLPRDAVITKLGEVLPTADYVYCITPKVSLKPSEIKAWSVRSESIQIDYGKDRVLVLNYDSIREVRLEQSGRYFVTRVYSTGQADPNKDHFQFLWKAEEKAKSAADLLGALIKH